ncbi:hypothetical protein [Pseudoclavibacter helvolus]|uniref:hypothetical protein n=1 Tax=Pseudoclavibacter helvolus TaxID=255205 RepID=UPI003C744B37
MMTRWRRAHSGVTIMALAGLLLVGCSETAVAPAADAPQSSTTVAPSTSTPTPEPPQPLALDDLLTAPAPEACGHPAGNLVDGTLPGIDRASGIVQLTASRIAADPATEVDPLSFAAFAPSPEAGGPAAVAVLECDQGGVVWPNLLVVYDTDVNLIASFDAADYTDGPNDNFYELAWMPDNSVQFSWTSHRYGEASCCGTLDSRERLTFDGDTAQITMPDIADVRSTAAAAYAAADSGDWASFEELSVDATISEYLQTDEYGLPVLSKSVGGRLICVGADDPGLPENLSLQFQHSGGATYACARVAEGELPSDAKLWFAPTLFFIPGAEDGEFLVQNYVYRWT